MAELLSEYEQKMAELNWIDQEQLPLMVTRFDLHRVTHQKLVFYLMDEIEPSHVRALQMIAPGDSSNPDVTGPELIAIRSEQSRDISAGTTTWSEVFHHPREELEQAVRRILGEISQHKEGANEREPGSRFENYVILTGDLSLYEDQVPAMSRRFRIPMYTSRGPSLISHPFIRRMLTYLKLEHNDFQIDDVFRVFADNRLVLPELKDHDEQKAPNIRHFSQFCRAYNFRTLKEVGEGLDRVFDGLLDQIVYEDDAEKEQRRREQHRRDRSFYTEVIRHLDALRRHYETEAHQPLDGWIAWTRSLLDLQKDLMSREANEARQLLEVILEKLATARARIGLDRTISRNDYFQLLELRLKETRERPDEKPGGVLLTEIRHLPEVHDKIVFILGLHEDGFPKPEKPDFLQFRYEKALQQLTGKDGTESYDLARMQLGRLLASTMPRYLSRPAYVEQKQVMPSPLWLDLEESLPHENARSWPDRKGISNDRLSSWLISNRDIGEWMVMNVAEWKIGRSHGESASRSPDDPDSQSPGETASSRPGDPDCRSPGKPANRIPAELLTPVPENSRLLAENFLQAAYAEKLRRDHTAMGRYDGVIDSGILKRWREDQGKADGMNMSISRLDSFATSPQEYFFKYVLRLQPLHEYQDDAESNLKGILLHKILQDFYTETAQEGPPIWPANDPVAARRRMESIRERTVSEFHHQLGNPESPFPDILRQNLERITRWFLDHEQMPHPDLDESLDDIRPAVFYPSYPFEMEHRWSFEKSVDGQGVLFRGMIDRIDITKDGEKAQIYDYKSGGSGIKSYNEIKKGLSYQLPVYGMYVREMGIPLFLAGYYRLPINGKMKDVERKNMLGAAEMVRSDKIYTGNGKRDRRTLRFKSVEGMNEFLSAIYDLRIIWIVRAIREGRFHLSLTGEPKWSDFRHITRHDNRIQMQRKNDEMVRRIEKEMEYELDRYYLDEPFRAEGDDG